MIERYALYETEKLRDQFHLPSGVPKGVKPRYNISPTQNVPVILARDGERVMELMRWGFVPQNSKDMNSVFRYKTYNVRSEDVFKKTSWEKSIRTQRCIIPANGFYVWQATDNGKQPYYVQTHSPSIMAFAGIYGSWSMPDGTTQGMFSLLTVPRNKDLFGYVNRSPILLGSDDTIAQWLNPEISDMVTLYDIMRTPVANAFSLRSVGEAINSTKPDSPSLII